MVAFRKPEKTYADLEALPEGVKAELLDGEIYMSPAPRLRHVRATSLLGAQLSVAFGMSAVETPRGPGGWWILDEPECHLLPDRRVFRPDIAGWRRERMPRPDGDTHKVLIVPDWVCEVLSPSTMSYDILRKMPRYREAGVRWMWVVDPVARRIDAFRAGEHTWEDVGSVEGGGSARFAPFEQLELDLSDLWLEPAPEPEPTPESL